MAFEAWLKYIEHIVRVGSIRSNSIKCVSVASEHFNKTPTNKQTPQHPTNKHTKKKKTKTKNKKHNKQTKNKQTNKTSDTYYCLVFFRSLDQTQSPLVSHRVGNKSRDDAPQLLKQHQPVRMKRCSI